MRLSTIDTLNAEKPWTTEASPGDGSFFFPNVPTVRVGAPMLRAIDNYGSGPDYEDRVLALQDDGNLVLSTKAGKAVWSTMGNGDLFQRPK